MMIPTPWSTAHLKVKKAFSTAFPEELHMKMKWIAENVPGFSIQKIVLQGTIEYVEKLLLKHYR
jgi:5'(3')-deoxyribonucleotidase